MPVVSGGKKGRKIDGRTGTMVKMHTPKDG